MKLIVTVVRETHLGAKKIFLRCRGGFQDKQRCWDWKEHGPLQGKAV